jgi:hypothetical protein
VTLTLLALLTVGELEAEGVAAVILATVHFWQQRK